MISMQELLHGNVISDVPHSHQINLDDLLRRINYVRTQWDKPMIVTSGYRFPADQSRIYGRINIQRQREGLSRLPIPMNSKHLVGMAVDIADSDGSLNQWLKDTPSILESAQLWCEERQGAWQHFQSAPPRSGNRWFQP